MNGITVTYDLKHFIQLKPTTLYYSKIWSFVVLLDKSWTACIWSVKTGLLCILLRVLTHV